MRQALERVAPMLERCSQPDAAARVHKALSQ
jgi:hypothetical protein